MSLENKIRHLSWVDCDANVLRKDCGFVTPRAQNHFTTLFPEKVEWVLHDVTGKQLTFVFGKQQPINVLDTFQDLYVMYCFQVHWRADCLDLLF